MLLEALLAGALHALPGRTQPPATGPLPRNIPGARDARVPLPGGPGVGQSCVLRLERILKLVSVVVVRMCRDWRLHAVRVLDSERHARDEVAPRNLRRIYGLVLDALGGRRSTTRQTSASVVSGDDSTMPRPLIAQNVTFVAARRSSGRWRAQRPRPKCAAVMVHNALALLGRNYGMSGDAFLSIARGNRLSGGLGTGSPPSPCSRSPSWPPAAGRAMPTGSRSRTFPAVEPRRFQLGYSSPTAGEQSPLG
jgi:hypothetical protein